MTTSARASITLLIAVILLAGGMSPAAATKSTHWDIPYPFADANPGEPDWSGTTVKGPRRRIDAKPGAWSWYEMRKLEWTAWGKKRAVGRGNVRYCSDECTDWSKAKIVLFRKRGLTCGDADGPTQFNYRRYRLVGFPYLEDGSTYRSAVIC